MTLIPPSSSGNVTGPAASVNGDLPVFSGTDGRTLADSGYSLGSLLGANAVLNILAKGPVVFYPINEGQGGIVHNLAIPSRYFKENLTGLSEAFYGYTAVWNGFTATENYALDMRGNKSATRLTAAGGAAPYQSILATLPPGTYTISMEVMSNTGAPQNIRFGYTDSVAGAIFGPDTAVGLTWAQLSYTFTTANNVTRVGILNDAAHTAADYLVQGFKVERGSVATAYEPQTLDQVVGTSQGTNAAAPSWAGGGLLFAGAQYTTGALNKNVVLKTISIYVAFKMSGAWALAGYAPIVSDIASNLMLSAANAASAGNSYGATFFFGGQSTVNLAYSVKLDDGNWHVLTGTYDGTTLKLYVDAALVASKAVACSAYTLKNFMLSNQNASAFFPGYIGAMAIFSEGHTLAQVKAVNTDLYALLAPRGITITHARNYLASEGDSFTGTPAGIGYVWKMVSNINPKIPAAQNFAQGGSTLVTATARAATVDAVLDSSRAHNILTVLFGANDLQTLTDVQFESQLQTYCQARRTAGWKVIVGTVLPSTGAGYNTKRNAVNTWIRANWASFADGVADQAADPVIGPDAAAADPTYYSGGLHPTAAGQLLMEPYWTAAINAITAT